MDAMRVGIGCRGVWLAGSMRAGRSTALFERGTAKGAWALQRRTLNLMGGELSPATRRRTRGAQRGSAIWIGENETSPAVPAVRIKLLFRHDHGLVEDRKMRTTGGVYL